MALGVEESSTLPPATEVKDVNGAKVAVPVIPTTKLPPPESPSEIRTRTLVVAAFWAVVIFLGLPVWWWTTSIHRARLPLQEMLEWADGKVSERLPLKLSMGR